MDAITTDEGMMMRVRIDAEIERRRTSNIPLTWLIEALRSGRYKQGRNKLARREDGEKEYKYCCLGVACELYQLHVGGLSIYDSGSDKMYDREKTHLPEKVRKWLGFETCGGEFVERLPSPDGRDRRADQLRDIAVAGGWDHAPSTLKARPGKKYENLVDANDDGWFTFEEIADILERGLVKGIEAYATA